MESRYHAVYAEWQADPEGFWLAQAKAIDWLDAPTKAFDADAGVYGRWFPDASCNTCFNALDRHVASGRGDQTAIIHDSPVTGTQRRLSYRELLGEVMALASSLGDLGVEKGDRVIIYMPMVPEAAIAMLACARLGAVHSVVFGGFAARELATRIDDCRPKAVLSASCGIEPGRTVAYKPLLDKAIELASHKPEATIILQRPQLEAAMTEGRDHDWAALRDKAMAEIAAGRAVPCTPVKATDPLYILYTSGTTGQPKGVVRDNGGHMVALFWSMEALFGVSAGEVWWAASDVGWVVGHSYIVYGPLLKGCTAVLFEGKPIGTPDAGTFWRLIAEHKVAALFTAPTAIRGIRKEDPEGELPGRHDLSAFRTLFLAGERADTETIRWAERALGVPVIDHWWQTESGWPIAINPAGLGLLPVKYGSPGVAVPGYDIQILDEDGIPLGRGAMGAIAIRLPLPPGALPTLWNADDRFRAAYLETFPGYYATADAGLIDEDGYLCVMGRTDDVINVAGHRLSTGEMEEAVSTHPAVAECAVIGMRDELKGELPCGFVVLKNSNRLSAEAIQDEVVALVRERIGPVAAFRRVIVVDRLPKTRSGKILRGTMKKIVDRDAFDLPATIEDAGALDEIERALGRG
ncbi:propionyl-CoA synthetase [Aureimonas sp. SA4125]|uniref:propionyl-CoA synthetase n=1 Tax=Aureimonas sp. SA4125 TaxID=2826993 RepID=UPI001CC445DE|nr:propionyl-CoA synthetase [Aureimonas sp. SA4125]BDA82696.1 propionyl-CoA synthetase [Aureimonas sp. SA4125]